MHEEKPVNFFAFLISLIILLLVLFFISNESYAKVLYDGESHKFSVGTEMDSNGSSIYEDSTAPYEGKKHIRMILVRYIIKDKLAKMSKNSAVGYGFNKWNPVDASKYKFIKFSAKSNLATHLFLTMLDDHKNGDSVQIQLDHKYSNFIIQLKDFGNINLKKLTTVVFHSQLNDIANLVVDIDSIELVR